jgi:hypothetical protein
MKHAATRVVFAYWDRLRGERAAPDRGEIEPGEIRHVLADTFILELAPDRSPELRLAGTRLCAFFGGELRGRRFDGLWAEESRRDPRRWIDIVVDETAGVVAGLTAPPPMAKRWTWNSSSCPCAIAAGPMPAFSAPCRLRRRRSGSA